MKVKEFIVEAAKPRNFVAKNAMKTTSGAGAHKDKKRADKQGDVKHKNKFNYKQDNWSAEFERRMMKDVSEGSAGEELVNEVYAEFERMYPNLARRANERTVHAAIMDVLNYGGDSNPGALAQDVARAVKRNMQGVAEGEKHKKQYEATFHGDMMRNIYSKYNKSAEPRAISAVIDFLMSRLEGIEDEKDEWGGDFLDLQDALKSIIAKKSSATWFELADAMFSYDSEFRDMMVDFAKEDLDSKLFDTLYNEVFQKAKQQIGLADIGKVDFGFKSEEKAGWSIKTDKKSEPTKKGPAPSWRLNQDGTATDMNSSVTYNKDGSKKKGVAEGNGKTHVSPSGVKTNMSPKDDDYTANYGKKGAVAKFRKTQGLDVKTGSKKVKEALSDTSLQALKKAKQDIEKSREADVSDWEKDFKQNFASKFVQDRPATAPRPSKKKEISRPNKSTEKMGPSKHLRNRTYPEVLALGQKAFRVADKVKALEKLKEKAEKMGLFNDPGLKADVDIELYMQNPEEDDYEALDQKLDATTNLLKDRIELKRSLYSSRRSSLRNSIDNKGNVVEHSAIKLFRQNISESFQDKKSLEQQLYNYEAAVNRAREATRVIKNADMHMEIIGEILELAKKTGIEETEFKYQIEEIYEAVSNLQREVYKLEEPFTDAVSVVQNAIDNLENEEWERNNPRGSEEQ